MKISKTTLIFFALAASFALRPAISTADPLSAEALRSLEASHQTSEGFQPGQHPGFAQSPATRRAIARLLQSMTAEERQAAREKLENMTAEERQSARQKLRQQSSESTKEQTL